MTKLPIYCGIDPGLANLTLMAYTPEYGVVDYVKLKAIQEGIPLDGVNRLSFLIHAIKAWLTEMKTNGEIQHIVLEGYAPHAEFQREQMGEASAVIRLALVQWFGLNNLVAYPTIISPPALKKFTIGKGSGPGTGKEDMKLHAFKRWGVEYTDNNVIDAYAAARVAHALHCGGEVTSFQQEVLSKLTPHTEWNRLLYPYVSLGISQSSSKSEPLPTRPRSRRSSATPSTKASTPNSAPSVRQPSTKRLKRVPLHGGS